MSISKATLIFPNFVNFSSFFSLIVIENSPNFILFIKEDAIMLKTKRPIDRSTLAKHVAASVDSRKSHRRQESSSTVFHTMRGI